MARLFSLTLLLLAGYTHASQRITGGEATTVNQHPSIVQVDSYNRWTHVWSQSCAGAILTNYFVLSAANCFHGLGYQPSHRRIRAGTTYRNTGGVLVNVLRENNHPSFNFMTMDNDITVVRLSTPLTMSAAIQQGSIPRQGYVFPDNAAVVQAGWGLTANDAGASSILRHASVLTINNALCRERYLTIPNRVVTINMICSGIWNVGGRGSCIGDFGGPMYYDQTIIGIISWGEGCGDVTFPSVNTAVSAYTNWIVRITQNIE